MHSKRNLRQPLPGFAPGPDLIFTEPLAQGGWVALRNLNAKLLKAHRQAQTTTKEMRTRYKSHSTKGLVLTVRYETATGPRLPMIGMWPDTSYKI